MIFSYSGKKLCGLWAHSVEDEPPPQMHDAWRRF